MFVWNYWPTISDLVREWRRNPDYSAGELVPFAAMYLAWIERKKFQKCDIQPAWWGIALILFAQAIRFYGLATLTESAERYSLILTFAGLILLLAGRQIFHQARWLMLFLLLMVPFPGSVHNTISFPLQNLASSGAVYILELFGVSVVQEGNVILLDNRIPIAIVEACSGLRLLTAFIIVSATLACLLRRPAWQKSVLLFSSIPIAIFCNLLRLSATAGLYLKVNDQIAEKFFHDFAGLTMMPVAIMLLLGEAYLMNKLVVGKPSIVRRVRIRKEVGLGVLPMFLWI
jgi:exosortase